jgi:hypothetical protein
MSRKICINFIDYEADSSKKFLNLSNKGRGLIKQMIF